MLNAKIKKFEKTKTQFGLKAVESLAAGEFIWVPHPTDRNLQKYLSWEQIQGLPAQEKEVFLWFGYQVGKNLFSGYTHLEDVASDDSNYMNHSCDPTVWYQAEIMVARKNIEVGQEITYDYGTDSYERDWDFTCHCGAPQCRGKVTRQDWRLLQNQYPQHLSPFIEEIIRTKNSA